MQTLRILFVTPYVPSPVRVRPYNLIRRLAARGHEVTVVTACTSEAEAADVLALARQNIRVESVRVPLHRSLWNCARGLATQLPLQALYAYSPALERRVAAELRRCDRRPYDLLHVEHLRAALSGLKASGVARLYDSVDCISSLFEQASQMSPTLTSRLRAFIDLERTRRFEGRAIHRFDHILTASEVDKESLAVLRRRYNRAQPQDMAGTISVVSNGVDVEHFKPPVVPRLMASLVFVGRMRYHANVAAVVYFVRDVLPRIWMRRPDVTFDIVGPDPPREVRALARRDGRVAVHGSVLDVRPYIGRATVSVSPLRYAVGVPNKILEAMAMATPVITTRVGVRSLGARHDEHVLVADDAADLEHQVLRLLNDRALRAQLGDSGRAYVEAHHDWATVTSRLEEIYHHTVTQFRSRQRTVE